MKRISFFGFIIFLSLISMMESHGQNCKKFHLYGKCMQYPGPYYKIEGQSRSNVIGVGDKLIYNVVFYGERTYKLIFCTSDMFYPVHFVLRDNQTRDMIYDSAKDDYPETVELNIDNTRRIFVEVSVLAHYTKEQFTEDYFGCLGFLIHWKPIGK